MTERLIEIRGLDSHGTPWAAIVPEGSPEAERLARLAERTASRRRDQRRLAQTIDDPLHVAEAHAIADRLSRPSRLRRTQLLTIERPSA